MGIRCVIVLVIFATFFIYSMPRESEGRLGVRAFFVGSRDTDLAPSSDTEEEMMEQILSNCKLDLLGTKYVTRAVDGLIPDVNAGDSNKLDIKEFLFLRGDLQEAISNLATEMKYSLIDCLINQILLVPFSVGTDSTNRLANDLAKLLDQGSLSRNNLEGQSGNKNMPSSTTFPDPALLPRRRAQVSKTTPVPAPIPENVPEGFSPTPLPGGYIESEVNNENPHTIASSEKKSNNTKTIIITVVVTATVTLTLAALCFCCFYRYLRSKYLVDNGERDERPLLSLNLSEFSGSSHVPFVLANSFHTDKNGALSWKADPNQNVSLTDTQVDAAHSSSDEPTNAPTPSETAPSPQPPLKQPHDRMSSSPHPAPPPLANPKPPPPPPAPAPQKGGPPLPKGAPPPPKGGPPPPNGGPPLPKAGPLPPKGPPRPPQASSSSSTVPRPQSHLSANAFASDGSKTKLKPFFWDKVIANPDQSMVWHQIKSGSFQFNEEMIETLFGYNATDKRWNEAKKDLANDPSTHHIQILDPKKSQNLAISLKAWNVKVEEVYDALMEGNELPVELLQALLKMAPTADEELKLRLFNKNTALLGPAEQFLKTIVNIPFAFKRMDALLLMTTLLEESTFVKDSMTTIEEACKELRNSRLFLKLLEAVLKTGNRMNDGTYRGSAQAFKLDTLLKLSDVKGSDGKTTLLNFVVQEIIRSEGRRAVRVARENRNNSSVAISSFNFEDFNVPEESEDQYRTFGLKVVSGLSNDLENVKKAAGFDSETLTGTVASLGHRLVKTKEFLNTDMLNLNEESLFHDSLIAFVEHAEADITYLLEDEKRIRLLVKNTTDYFHESAGRDEGLRLFVIVRDFLGMLDKACKVVREVPKKVIKTPRTNDNPTPQLIPVPRELLFPAIKERHMDDFSSDDEGF